MCVCVCVCVYKSQCLWIYGESVNLFFNIN